MLVNAIAVATISVGTNCLTSTMINICPVHKTPKINKAKFKDAVDRKCVFSKTKLAINAKLLPSIKILKWFCVLPAIKPTIGAPKAHPNSNQAILEGQR